MSERMQFLLRLQAGERMTDLCREFKISRKTGYKLRDRFIDGGLPAAVVDRSRAPQRLPHRTSEQVRAMLVAAREAHPTWGPRKLRAWLLSKHPGVSLPAPSTIGDLLKREGLVRRRRRRATMPVGSITVTSPEAANELWCADYKGQFRLGNRKYCYPLTITDRGTRYLLACEAFAAIDGADARTVFEATFREYGLPAAIRTDNGPPFAARGLHGLSKLSAWWLRLGIRLERIEPGHPEQNGQHERMHLTLKQETTRPAADALLQQQERFDKFIEEYNHERPHEALGQTPPARHYERSPRVFKGEPQLSYPLHDRETVIGKSGHLRMGGRGNSFFLSSALAGQPVGLREVDDHIWLVTYAALDLGLVNLQSRSFTPMDVEPDEEQQQQRVSPMLPV